MTSVRLAVLATTALLASSVIALGGVAQDWRARSLAAFDVVWQTVRDSHYDPTFAGVDWNSMSAAYRPRVEAAPTAEAARDLMREMLGRLGQSHFDIIASGGESDSLRGDASLPLSVRVVDTAVLVTAVRAGSAAAGLRPGDRLLTIDGRPAGPTESAERVRPRLRDALAWRRVSQALSGASGELARVTWRTPDGIERAAAIPRVVEDGESVVLGNLPPLWARVSVEDLRTPTGLTVGVVGFTIWLPAISEPFAQAIDRFRNADGLIIDLRGNPGGLADMIRGIAGHLLGEPALLGRMRMRHADLEFRANPRRATSDGRRVEPFAGPVAVLIDGLTASASECFAGGLQSLGRVRVFGTPSMGQALPASTRSLPNGDVLLYAVGDFVTSTGARLEGEGVLPDEIVPLVPSDLAAGRDARARAISWIEQQSANRPKASGS